LTASVETVVLYDVRPRDPVHREECFGGTHCHSALYNKAVASSSQMFVPTYLIQGVIFLMVTTLCELRLTCFLDSVYHPVLLKKKREHNVSETDSFQNVVFSFFFLCYSYIRHGQSVKNQYHHQNPLDSTCKVFSTSIVLVFLNNLQENSFSSGKVQNYENKTNHDLSLFLTCFSKREQKECTI
jgi:hypothetical protein